MAQDLVQTQAALTPKEVDQQILKSLGPSVARVLHEEWSNRSTPEYGWDGEFIGYRVGLIRQADGSEEIPELRQRNLVSAAALVAEELRPCPGDLIMAELARLRVSTRSKDISEGDLTLTFEVFAELCEQYPADVVIDALRYWGGNHIFWPSVAELKAELEYRVRKRRALLKALQEARDAN